MLETATVPTPLLLEVVAAGAAPPWVVPVFLAVAMLVGAVVATVVVAVGRAA